MQHVSCLIGHLHMARQKHVEKNMLDSHHQNPHVELSTTVTMKISFLKIIFNFNNRSFFLHFLHNQNMDKSLQLTYNTATHPTRYTPAEFFCMFKVSEARPRLITSNPWTASPQLYILKESKSSNKVNEKLQKDLDVRGK